jgi:hypothetical protein
MHKASLPRTLQKQGLKTTSGGSLAWTAMAAVQLLIFSDIASKTIYTSYSSLLIQAMRYNLLISVFLHLLGQDTGL